MEAFNGLIGGIDPGVSGGLGALNHRGEVVYCWGLPVREVAIHGGIEKWLDGGEFSRLVGVLVGGGVKEVWMEDVRGRGGWGANVTFSFGGGFHAARVILEAAGVPVRLVPPQCWRKFYGMGKADRGKRESLDLAGRIWGGAGIGRRDGVAEACLIARYGLEVYAGLEVAPAVIGDLEEVKADRRAVAKLKREIRKRRAVVVGCGGAGIVVDGEGV